MTTLLIMKVLVLSISLHLFPLARGSEFKVLRRF